MRGHYPGIRKCVGRKKPVLAVLAFSGAHVTCQGWLQNRGEVSALELVQDNHLEMKCSQLLAFWDGGGGYKTVSES